MKFFSIVLLICLTVCSCSTSRLTSSFSYKKKTVREVVFTEKDRGTLPKDFETFRGFFHVRKLGPDPHALHVSPIPLEPKALYFGPEVKNSVCISADIFASSDSEGVIPLFGIGAQSGFKLLVTQSTKYGPTLTLFHGGSTALATLPLTWRTLSWTSMKLEIYQSPSYFKQDPHTKKTSEHNHIQILAKAWRKGTPEPKWMLKAKLKDLFLPEGKCSIWATPYSGNDIFFNRLLIQVPTNSNDETLKAAK